MTPQFISENLEKQLQQRFGKSLPAQAAHDIHNAMKLVQIFEQNGFSFELKDLFPRSLDRALWRAAFTKDGVTVSADDPGSHLAICKAALGALTPSLST